MNQNKQVMYTLKQIKNKLRANYEQFMHKLLKRLWKSWSKCEQVVSKTLASHELYLNKLWTSHEQIVNEFWKWYDQIMKKSLTSRE